MDEIITLAERLAKAIAESTQAADLRTGRDAMRAEDGLEQTLKDYSEQAQKVGGLADENKPIEVDDKHKLQEFETKLASSEAFKKFTAAQVEYVDLMRKVNDTLHKGLAETESV